MNRFEGVLGVQTRALVDVLRKQQETRCREIIAAAEQQAKQAVQQAREKLRKRQRDALDEERQRRQHELLVAASRIESHARRRAFARYEQVLGEAWPRLAEALGSRWADGDGRRAWCELIVTEAAATLSPGEWLVEHPDAWSADDRKAVEAQAAERGIPVPAFSDDASIAAGLRIRAGSACLDGTDRGLLASREDVEALLLACWEEQDTPGAADG
jgi:vacuolar-type H+-ATPase subunit E/Vma4